MIPWWKLLPYGVAILAAGGVWYSIEQRGVEKGKAEVVQASKEKGKDANAKNERERKRAAAPGAAERLLKDRDTCRDCQ